MGSQRPVLAPAHELIGQCMQRDGHKLMRRGLQPSRTLAPYETHQLSSPVTGVVASSHKRVRVGDGTQQ
jgi:hypothetical protein